MCSLNNCKSQNVISKSCRFQKIESVYPQLSEIKDKKWIEIIGDSRLIETDPKVTFSGDDSSFNNFMLILEGTIRIYQTADDGREITLYRVQAGEVCLLNLNLLLENKTFNAVATTESHVETLAISPQSFRFLMDTIKPFREYIISCLIERLYKTTCMIQDTVFNNLDLRLACMLGILFERANDSVLKITHQKLAFEIGTTREVVSRILKDFEKQNCIKLSRGSIELVSAEALEWIANSN
ncbi:MAG: Crp/Fnr family transcriptional regulator [endosymbiont of Galathealinum brachiosum]|uniref:Crp/Fnr family transcriptional regulator n=1 Tax=endosymbiont of Galathealinum brachiosum TaxID=2200906 RepID=A0A370DIU4_9GAMM|nr:MAG: Crp/Fnr family transcriptional regulator [endosymbiont of Galathealinum brachiosum]